MKRSLEVMNPLTGSDDASASMSSRLTGPDLRSRPALPVPRGLVRHARTVAEAMFSSESGPPPPERLDWLERELADFLGRTGFLSMLVLRLCLFVVYASAPLMIGRFRFLSSLDVKERCRALDGFDRSALSPALLACKAILCILYFEHPDATAETGFDGKCLRSAP
jgi:hypothetical protein